MKSLWVVATLVLLLCPIMLLAQRTTTIRLGTVLPANSMYDRLLKQMSSEWQKATDGRVRLRVASGGTQGDEGTIIRRMRLNTSQAAALTQVGLAEIDDSFSVIAIPFFFESDEEVFYVLDKLTPRFEKALADAGLVLLNWGHGGWVHFFSTERVKTLDDLRKVKVYTSAGDDWMVQWYKENGFGPVPLALTDVLMGLNTGLINAYPSPPVLRAGDAVVPKDVLHAGRLSRTGYRRDRHHGTRVASDQSGRQIGDSRKREIDSRPGCGPMCHPRSARRSRKCKNAA